MLVIKKLRYSVKKQNCALAYKLIPYFFTFANALLGLLAIIKTFDGEYRVAAYCILLAAFMDACDGGIARALGSTSYFGMELDSLCDAISFCLAPTILLYSWLPDDIPYWHLAFLGLYLCAGLSRLARFNLTHQQQATIFKGLPTTIAAFLIATLILDSSKIQDSFLHPLLNISLLDLLLCFLALLMLSSLPFPSAKQCHILKKAATLKIVFIALTLGFCFLKQYPVYFLSIASYVFGTLTIAMYKSSKQILNALF